MADPDFTNVGGTGKYIREQAKRLIDTSDDEAVIQQSLAENSLKNGDQYIFRETFTLSDTDTQAILVENPTGSDAELRAVNRRIDPDNPVTGTISANVTVDTRGTDFQNVNALINDPAETSSPFNIQYDGAYSGGTQVLPVRTPDTSNTPVGSRATGAIYRIVEGANLLYELSSATASNNITFELIISQRPQ